MSVVVCRPAGCVCSLGRSTQTRWILMYKVCSLGQPAQTISCARHGRSWRDGWRCSLQGIVWAGRPKLLAVYASLCTWVQKQCTRYSLGQAAQTISCVSHDALGFSALYSV